jgi:hypothetical protein
MFRSDAPFMLTGRALETAMSVGFLWLGLWLLEASTPWLVLGTLGGGVVVWIFKTWRDTRDARKLCAALTDEFIQTLRS